MKKWTDGDQKTGVVTNFLIKLVLGKKTEDGSTPLIMRNVPFLKCHMHHIN